MASTSTLSASSEGLVATSGQHLTLGDLKQSRYYQCYSLKCTGRMLHTIHPIDQFWLKRLTVEEQRELYVQVEDTLEDWRSKGLDDDEWRIMQTRARLTSLLELASLQVPQESVALPDNESSPYRNDKHSVQAFKTHTRRFSDSLTLSEASDEELECAASFYGSSADSIGSQLEFFSPRLEDTPEAMRLESRRKLQSQLPRSSNAEAQDRPGASIHPRAMDSPLSDTLSETAERSSVKSESYSQIALSNRSIGPTFSKPAAHSKPSKPNTSVSVLPRETKRQSSTKSNKRPVTESPNMTEAPLSQFAYHIPKACTEPLGELSRDEPSYTLHSPITKASNHKTTEPDTEHASPKFDKQTSPPRSRMPCNSFELLDNISLSWSIDHDNIPSASEIVRAVKNERTSYHQRSTQNVGYALATSSKIDATPETKRVKYEEAGEHEIVPIAQAKSGLRVESQEPINLSFNATEPLNGAALEQLVTEYKTPIQEDGTISEISINADASQNRHSLGISMATRYSSTLKEATKAQLLSVATDISRSKLNDNKKWHVGTPYDDSVESEEPEFHDAQDHFEIWSHTPEYNLDDFVAVDPFCGDSDLTTSDTDEDETQPVSINVDSIRIIFNVPRHCAPHIVVDGRSIDLTYVGNSQNEAQNFGEIRWLYCLAAVSYLFLVMIIICAPIFIKPTRAGVIGTADASDMSLNATCSLDDICHWSESFDWTYMCSRFTEPDPSTNTSLRTSEILDSSKALKGSSTSIIYRIDGRAATRATVGTAIMLYLASIVVFAQRLHQVQLHH